MKYCTKCGTQLNDDDLFCTKCGNKAPELKPELETVNPSNKNEINNTDSEFTNTPNNSKINIIKKLFLNHKMLVTITVVTLCMVIIGIICLKNMPYKCFDIKDDQLIEILNECGAYTSQSPLQVDGFDPDTTIYRVTCEDEIGLLVLSHSFSGHIRCIMICFEDNNVYAAAIISAIASELDYSFSTTKAMNSLLLDDEAYSSNKYTAIMQDLSLDLTGVFLAPTQHLEYCVKSVLDN